LHGIFRMKIAITIWDERVSPVFDAAHSLLIANINHKTVKKITYESFSPQFEARLIERLNHLQIEVLICGAISQAHSTLIEANGIVLIPFISGRVNKILESFARGDSISPAFLMPGCRDSPLV